MDNLTKDKNLFLALVFILAVHLGLFIYINTRPLYWIHNELLLHRFFWSMNDINDFTLHLGFNRHDWIKPFHAMYVDGIFRTRQLSYFVEMLSYKFWQWLDVGFIRNYTLIFIHILNVVLLGILTKRLTQNNKTALFVALFSLNAGVCAATLIFPFRNAKLLVMTFFLLAWIILAKSKDRFSQTSFKNQISFYGCMLAMLFTDETGYIFALGLIFLLLMKEGKAIFKDQRICLGLTSTLLVFLSLCAVFFKIFMHLKSSGGNFIEFAGYLSNFPSYFTHLQTLTDTACAFFQYFLKYNFGYWDKTSLGILSFLSFLFILIMMFFVRRTSIERKLIGFLFGMIFLKAFFLPHNGGVHAIIMPPQTFFPSLLFFSYYYTYMDALLIVLAIGLALNAGFKDFKTLLIVMIPVTIMNFSNVIALKNGPPDALAFHDWDKDYRRAGVQSFLTTKEFLTQNRIEPVYLSFPTGNNDIFRGRIDDGDAFVYARVVPIMFLKPLVDGRALISLKNIVSKVPRPSGNELSMAHEFYDVGTSAKYNLEKLKKLTGEEKLVGQEIKNGQVLTQKIEAQVIAGDFVLFFIKGSSDFVFTINGQKLLGKQFYGESYQFFDYNLASKATNSFVQIKLQVRGSAPNQQSYLVGPFIAHTDIKE